MYSPAQEQTKQTFAFKWKKRDTYESNVVSDLTKKWLQERYALPGITFEDLIKNKTILDAGCGSGVSSLLLFGDFLNQCRYIGVDISDAIEVALERFTEKKIKGEFLQADLLNIPEEFGSFDIIFSEGVLHHTDSTEKAIRTLAKRIREGGYFMFYVYNKKGPLREFTDDFIRDRLSTLNDEEAWEELVSLSKLGKSLGELNVEINIEEPVGLLGIPAGKINLQRLFYWHIFKCFYRPEWGIEEMNHVNFDWYRPQNCHRQTPEEVKSWVEASGLKIHKMDVQEAGITVVSQKEQ
ncbi:MAG: SAM-dependent methyltransferase [Desulfobacterales bacterium]|nr:MAG: SAM-dependent methyltransferase [Desulfobacterales bacterium]